jgi:hypothetical protein
MFGMLNKGWPVVPGPENDLAPANGARIRISPCRVAKKELATFPRASQSVDLEAASYPRARRGTDPLSWDQVLT